MRKRVYISNIVVAALVITTTVFAQPEPGVKLQDKYTGYEGSQIVEEYTENIDIPYYNVLLEEYNELGYVSGTNSIDISLKDIKENNDNYLKLENFEEYQNVYIWDKHANKLEFDVVIPNDGLYEMEVEYFLLPDSSNAAVRGIELDGKNPFIEANNLIFYRMFKDAKEPVVNSLGDQMRPSQEAIPGWQITRCQESTGIVENPLQFYLTQGKHQIGMKYISQDMAIKAIRLIPTEEIKSYKEVKQDYEQKGYTSGSGEIYLEAETEAIAKNDPTLRRESDGDPTVSPRSVTNRILNTLGGYRWRKGNQSITWEFKVSESGLYKIGIRNKQSWNDGLPSYRQIAIDGVVPFKELSPYAFGYNDKWNLEVLSNQEEPFLFYLEEGKHTLTMTVKFGDLTPVIESINEDNIILSKILMDLILITGSDPDPNYDYDFFTTIPDLQQNLQELADSLQWKYDYLQGITDKTPAMSNNFMVIKKQIESMIADPFSIAKKINDLNNAQSNLSSWYISLQSQPLLVDYFLIGNKDTKWKDEKASIFQKFYTTIANFCASFVKDYDNVGGVLAESIEITDTIDVWVARGTEWAEVIKEMADEEFTPYTGIKINLNVLPASQLSAGAVNTLMLAITSGRAPDVALGVDVNSPVEFAIRDAVYDLSKMPGYEEVEKRFLDGIMIPYQYNGGTYALPETMDFNVMFYRKDILHKLGLKVPDTRQELYTYVMPVLYQNGMEFNYSKDFTQLLFQHEGAFYTPDGLQSALDSPEAFKAFKEYTEMYTHYGVPEVSNFYNRMRSGEMPIGIGNFGLYMQLSVAAPELAGKWGIAPLPGIEKQGIVDRTSGGVAGQADIILKQSDQPEASWEFLKWWSSTSVQVKFAREVEALMGAEARWNTANLEAFTSLSWEEEDIRVLEEQWKWAKETPVVLGGYFTSRHITNAWTTTVISGGDARDALENAVKEINRELRMKQEEYGIFRE